MHVFPAALLHCIVLSLCAYVSRGQCLERKTIGEGICNATKKCMCGHKASSRLAMLHHPHAKLCGGRARIDDFNVPPSFSYHLAKGNTQYLVMFIESGVKDLIYVHWFEGDIPGYKVKAGDIVGRKTMPYYSIRERGALREGHVHRYQILLFEQPMKNMMERVRIDQRHDVYHRIPARRQWYGLGSLLTKYNMCGNLVAGYQFLVGYDGADSSILNMCDKNMYHDMMEPILHFGVNTKTGLSRVSCWCSLLPYSFRPVHIVILKFECPTSDCPWKVVIWINMFINGCYNLTKEEHCCVPPSMPKAMTIPNYDRNHIAIRVKRNDERRFMGNLTVSAKFLTTDRDKGLFHFHCDSPKPRFRDGCMRRNPGVGIPPTVPDTATKPTRAPTDRPVQNPPTGTAATAGRLPSPGGNGQGQNSGDNGEDKRHGGGYERENGGRGHDGGNGTGSDSANGGVNGDGNGDESTGTNAGGKEGGGEENNGDTRVRGMGESEAGNGGGGNEDGNGEENEERNRGGNSGGTAGGSIAEGGEIDGVGGGAGEYGASQSINPADQNITTPSPNIHHLMAETGERLSGWGIALIVLFITIAIIGIIIGVYATRRKQRLQMESDEHASQMANVGRHASTTQNTSNTGKKQKNNQPAALKKAKLSTTRKAKKQKAKTKAK